jgi:hypothetical protein
MSSSCLTGTVGSRTVALVALALVMWAGGGVAYAEHDQRPIAVPRVGTQGPASVYPATINVVAPGG